MGGSNGDVDGAHATLAGLFARHRPRLRTILRRLGVGEANLDDAVQDVFVVLVRRIEEHDGADEGSVQAWLRGIARRIASNHRRSASRALRLRTELESAAAPSSTADEHDRLDTAAVLHSFLDGLTPEQCEAFVLGEVHGLTGPEIASRLAINLDTAYSRLRAARRELQRTVARVRARERRPTGSGVLAFLPRLAIGATQMQLFVPAIFIAANVVAATVQVAARSSVPQAPIRAESTECVASLRVGGASAPGSSTSCAERHRGCRTRVDACRGVLASCERTVLERMPMPLKFEELPPNPSNEARVEPSIARISAESGSEIAVECHGDICLLLVTTTDAVFAVRAPEMSPAGLLRGGLGDGIEVTGATHETASPSTDFTTGEGIWLARIWIQIAMEEGGDPP